MEFLFGSEQDGQDQEWEPSRGSASSMEARLRWFGQAWDPMEAADWLWSILSKSAANASIRSAKLCGVTDSAAVMYAFTQMVF